MKKIIIPGLIAAALMCASLEAVVPQKWELRSKEDFLRGKFDGVSLSFDGALSLAPREEKLEGPTEEFYLSLLPLPDGSLFLGTGHGGKIYRIGKDGKSELYYQSAEMDVTSLVRDSKGVLYAGTSPNGKIYKITGKAVGEEFFNPAEKYIWDLMFNEAGNLLVAVGENGGIYEVSPQGEGRQILKAGENHILCLRKDSRGTIVAGSGGGGLIYRLAGDGRPSVLFESPYEEIRSLVLDGDGNVYAAASGSPTKTRKEEAATPSVKSDTDVVITVSASGTRSETPSESGASAPGGRHEPSALYKVSPDGVARILWSSDDELIYSVVWREEGKSVVFGTGGEGRIYSIGPDEKPSLLLQKSSEETYLLLPTNGKTYVLGNNPCYLGVLYPDQRLTGEYLSPALDAKTVARWGRMEWTAGLEAGTTLQVQTRSGNTVEPGDSWSDWSPPSQGAGEQVLSPKARFLQLRVLLKTQSGRASPSLEMARVYYLPANLSPAFTRMGMLEPNEVYIKLPDQEDIIWGEDGVISEETSKQGGSASPLVSKKAERRGFRTILWDAADGNGDRLTYAVSIRKEGESLWRVLQPRWSDPVFAFNTLAFSDGTYFLKVVASDVPSNPLGTELTAEKISPPIVIDNSLPEVKAFTLVRNAGGLDVSFQAEDSYSFIEEVQYLVRPDVWRVVFPADGICDSRAETFKFTVRPLANAENLITIRVKDHFGNVGIFNQTY
jgi:hypothetical protein